MVEFNTVYLTFDTFLDVNTKRWPPLHKSAECVRDYKLKIFVDEDWKVIDECKGNYFRRRIHHFNTVKTQILRVDVEQTNGDNSARIYEIRVYKENLK